MLVGVIGLTIGTGYIVVVPAPHRHMSIGRKTLEGTAAQDRTGLIERRFGYTLAITSSSVAPLHELRLGLPRTFQDPRACQRSEHPADDAAT